VDATRRGAQGPTHTAVHAPATATTYHPAPTARCCCQYHAAARVSEGVSWWGDRCPPHPSPTLSLPIQQFQQRHSRCSPSSTMMLLLL
jgi:hypothetical protein